MLAGLVLFLQTEVSALDFLLRHQAADGSWGPAPPACRCPPSPRPGPVLEVDLQSLWEDDPRRVAEAQRRLEEAGVDALSRLRRAAEGIDAAVRARHFEVVRRIGRSREGCDVELTALALLAFEKDGEAVRRGLAWLVARQREDGSCGGDDGEADGAAARAVIRWSHCGEAATRARKWLTRNPRDVSGRLEWLAVPDRPEERAELRLLQKQ